MIQRRKTMLLTGFLHAGKLGVIEPMPVDVSPIVGRCVHWETGSDGPVGSNDDIVLASPTVPLGKVHLAVCILDNSGSIDQPFGNVSIAAAAVTVSPLAAAALTGFRDESISRL